MEKQDTLKALGFALAEDTFLGINNPVKFQRWTREGFEGSIELDYDREGNERGWAHRTPACGPGTGVRPIGGTSTKAMAKHIRKHI